MSSIEVNNLKKYFGKTKAVDGISFEVEKGEIFGFLGPNGAGKTTTIRCMMDFLRPDGGQVKISGLDAQKDTVAAKKKLGYLSSDDRIYRHLTGKAHIEYVAALRGSSDGAEKYAKGLDLDLSKKAWQLSTGNRQKLELVLSMMSEPEILIMDEPTVGLDPILQNKIYEMLENLASQGKTIFMSSHNLPEVEKICTKVAIIRQGKIEATESISGLKSKKMYTVEANFESEYDKNEFITDGIEIVDGDHNTIKLSVKGNVNDLINILQKYKLKDLEIKRASLEEIFLEFYK